MDMEPAAVTSRDDLARFVGALRDEHRADPDAWANADLDRSLEALAAWVRDSPGSFADQGQPEPETPDWSWVALSLRAATLYEWSGREG